MYRVSVTAGASLQTMRSVYNSKQFNQFQVLLALEGLKQDWLLRERCVSLAIFNDSEIPVLYITFVDKKPVQAELFEPIG